MLPIVEAGEVSSPAMPVTIDSAPQPATNSDLRPIVLAWLVAGTLDVSAAVIYYPLTGNVTAKQILQGIASGLLGAQAFEGGLATAVLGLGLHYVIALAWTVVFYVAARNVGVLARRPLIVGPVYGAFVWIVMNLIVLPMSHVAHRPLRVQPSIVGAVILMICIGIPIATILGRRVRR